MLVVIFSIVSGAIWDGRDGESSVLSGSQDGWTPRTRLRGPPRSLIFGSCSPYLAALPGCSGLGGPLRPRDGRALRRGSVSGHRERFAGRGINESSRCFCSRTRWNILFLSMCGVCLLSDSSFAHRLAYSMNRRGGSTR
jgi:hypothetical protein